MGETGATRWTLRPPWCGDVQPSLAGAHTRARTHTHTHTHNQRLALLVGSWEAKGNPQAPGQREDDCAVHVRIPPPPRPVTVSDAPFVAK